MWGRYWLEGVTVAMQNDTFTVIGILDTIRHACIP